LALRLALRLQYQQEDRIDLFFEVLMMESEKKCGKLFVVIDQQKQARELAVVPMVGIENEEE
jgi:hypothetical protein